MNWQDSLVALWHVQRLVAAVEAGIIVALKETPDD